MSRVLSATVLSIPLIGAYGIFAIGITLMYQASRMLNLAHGAMAMVPAFFLYSLSGWGVPLVVALPLALASGAALGYLVEKVFVARLRSGGPTAQTVGTVAALGLFIALAARIYGTSSVNAVEVFPRGSIPISLSVISYGDIGLFVVLLVVSAALVVLIQRTDLGLMMRGVAESRLAASLMGVDPGRITSLSWILGGTLAALGGILLAAVTTLDVYGLSLQVLPAFIAALIGGLGSFYGALAGATVVGLTQGMVPILGAVGQWPGAPQLALALTAMVVMAIRGNRLSGADQSADDLGAPGESSDDDAEQPTMTGPSPRRRLTLFAAVAGAVILPFLGFVPSSLIASINLAASYAIVAVSLVLLIGWVGQISLGHAAFVGIGAYATGYIVAGVGIPFPFSLPLAAAVTAVAAAGLGVVALRVRGLYLAVATLVFTWMASEFLFRQSWVTSNATIPAQIAGTEGSFPYFDLSNRRTFYFIVWASAALVLAVAANMRDSKTGRAFFAIRGSEIAAASLGIDVVRYKLVAFAASGAMAGVAGSLLMTDFRVVTNDQFTFTASLFFLAVAVVGGLRSLPGAVAAGLLFGLLGELFFRVPALGAYLELTSALLLAAVLLAWRGGLASIPQLLSPWLSSVSGAVRKGFQVAGERAARRAEQRRAQKQAEAEVPPEVPAGVPGESEPGTTDSSRPGRLARRSRAQRKSSERTELPLDFSSLIEQAMGSSDATAPLSSPGGWESSPSSNNGQGLGEAAAAAEEARRLLRERLAAVRPKGLRANRRLMVEAADVTVRFGGLVAVNNASLQVREGEIVGLIGPNGAGKTTLFNAIAGYNDPSDGAIRLYGRDVTNFSVHRRAQAGVGRTFQHIQLFGDLSVHDNLLVATHVHNSTGVLSHITVAPGSIRAEREARKRVSQVIELMELGDVARKPVSGLPFGILRMVEVARALVTGFRVIMLDEPASGLDDTETDRLIEVLRFVRGLGVTMLLIEHDIRMVTGISDYLYVLNQGRVIAHGPPEKVQRNPEVIAAYLGEPAEGSGDSALGSAKKATEPRKEGVN